MDRSAGIKLCRAEYMLLTGDSGRLSRNNDCCLLKAHSTTVDLLRARNGFLALHLDNTILSRIFQCSNVRDGRVVFY